MVNIHHEVVWTCYKNGKRKITNMKFEGKRLKYKWQDQIQRGDHDISTV